MKTIRFLSFAIILLIVNIAFAADEIHWTVTGKDSVTFDWRGTSAENSIGYGLTSGNYTQVTATTPNPVPVSSYGPFWEAKLTGLTANTRYYYKIGTGPERNFRTAPAPGGSDFNVYAQGNIGSSSTYFNMGVVQDLIANDLPAFVIGLGDLTLGNIDGKAAIDQHFNDVMMWSTKAAYMPVWGDLDTISNKRESFKNYKGRFAVPNSQASLGSPLAGGEDWYWLDYGNARFITLPEPWSGALDDWKTKASALMAQAQADPNIKFIVTFVHRPAYSSGHYTGSSTLKSMLDALGDTYSKYDLNVNAHSNNYERSLPQHGVTHITAGSGGANLTQDGTCLWLTCTKPSWSAFRAMHLGALKLHFTASGVEGSFICGPAGGGVNDVTCATGSVVDRFIIGAMPPMISGVSALNITKTDAQITWTLDQPATGQVEYGTTTSYGQQSTLEPSFQYTAHTQPLSGLAPGTQYHFRVRSTNQAGAKTVSSDYTFTTAPDALTISAVSASNITETGATINWALSAPGTGRVDYGTTAAYGQMSTLEPSFLYSSHSQTLSGLAPGKLYHYRVRSTNLAGVESVSGDLTFTTAGTPPVTIIAAPITGPTISAVSASNITQTDATISWTLSEVSTGQVEYGTTNLYGQMSVKEPSFLYITHIQTLSGLAPGTLYHYRLHSSNQAGVESVSGDFTFTTLTNTTTSVTNTTTSSYHAPAPTSSLVVNVMNTGATGNGGTNDTAAIQAAINQVGGTGGTVYVPDGTYMVDAVTRLWLRSNMTFKMSSGAVLKAIPNNSGHYDVLKIEAVSNVNVIGGTIFGERHQHLVAGDNSAGLPDGLNGQWGYGIGVYGGHGIYIEGVTVKECWGDGIYIGENSTNVNIYSVISDGNRRQGMSIVWADGVIIRDSIFKNTWGAQPMAGIDLEPDGAGTWINNVLVTGSQFTGNAFDGISISAQVLSGVSNITNVTFTGNTSANNGQMGLWNQRSGTGIAFSNNTLTSNGLDGIRVEGSTSSNNTYVNNIISSSPTRTGDNASIRFKNGATANVGNGNSMSGYTYNVKDETGGNSVM